MSYIIQRKTKVDKKGLRDYLEYTQEYRFAWEVREYELVESEPSQLVGLGRGPSPYESKPALYPIELCGPYYLDWVRPVGDRKRFYYPLKEVPDLAFRLAQVKEKRDVLSFVNRYGRLGLDKFYLRRDGDGELVVEILREAAHIRQLLEIYLAYRCQDLKSLKEWVHIDEHGRSFVKRVRSWLDGGEIAIPGPNLDFSGPKRPPESRAYSTIAILYLTEAIGPYLSGVQPIFLIRAKGPIEQGLEGGYTCRLLINAIYLQLFQLMSELGKLKKCKYCQSWFAPQRSNQEVCEPACGNRYRKRKHDARKRKVREEQTQKSLAKA